MDDSAAVGGSSGGGQHVSDEAEEGQIVQPPVME